MDDGSDVARVTIQSHRGALIASIQVDLEERVLRRFQSDLLEQVRSSKARAVIIDLTGVEVMDGTDFDGLRRTIDMVALMGTPTILCGLRPGVAAALVDLNVATEGLQTCLSLDRALDAVAAAESGDPNVAATEGSRDQEPTDEHPREKTLDRD